MLFDGQSMKIKTSNFLRTNPSADRGRYAVEIWLLVIAFKRLGVSQICQQIRGDFNGRTWFSIWRFPFRHRGTPQSSSIYRWNFPHK